MPYHHLVGRFKWSHRNFSKAKKPITEPISLLKRVSRCAAHKRLPAWKPMRSFVNFPSCYCLEFNDKRTINLAPLERFTPKLFASTSRTPLKASQEEDIRDSHTVKIHALEVFLIPILAIAENMRNPHLWRSGGISWSHPQRHINLEPLWVLNYLVVYFVSIIKLWSADWTEFPWFFQCIRQWTPEAPASAIHD